jgi:hypothetical protein
VLRLWQEGAITNFDYLMQLNKLAGRTFNDLMQYPVFPFVLADYTSPSLNLYREESFRDLRRPIAIQNESKRERYVSNYNILAEDMASQDDEGRYFTINTFFLLYLAETYHFDSCHSVCIVTT